MSMKRNTGLGRLGGVCLATVALAMSVARPAHAGFWEDLTDESFVAGTAPAVASSGTNRLDVFARTASHGYLWHKVWTGTWSRWYHDAGDPGAELYSPAAVSRGTDLFDVFVTGADNAVYWKAAGASGFEATWHNLGGCIASSPAISMYRPPNGTATRMDLWAVGCNGEVWHRAWTGGPNWSGWDDGAGKPSGGIAVGSSVAANATSDGVIRLFVRGVDNALYYKFWDGSNWTTTDWTYGGGSLASDPAVASYQQNSMDRIDVYAKGSDGYLWHRAYEGVAWRNWENMYRTVAGAPAVIAWNPSAEARLDLFASLGTGYTHGAFSGMYDAAYPALTADWISPPYKVVDSSAAGSQHESYGAFFPPQVQPPTRAVLSLGLDPVPGAMSVIRYGDPASLPLTSYSLSPPAGGWFTGNDNYLMRSDAKTVFAVRHAFAPDSGVAPSPIIPARVVDQFYRSTDYGQTFTRWGTVDGKDVWVGGIHPWAYPSATGKNDAGVDYPTLYLDPFTGDRYFTTQLAGQPTAGGKAFKRNELLFRANIPNDLKYPITESANHMGNMTSVPSGRLFTAADCESSTAFGASDITVTWLEHADLYPRTYADAPIGHVTINTLNSPFGALPQCVRVACTPNQDPTQCSNEVPWMDFNLRSNVVCSTDADCTAVQGYPECSGRRCSPAGGVQAFIGMAQLSRVGSFPVGDVIRVAYPAVVTLNGHHALIEQIVTLLIDSQNKATILAQTQIASPDTISGRGFVGQFTFIETDRQDLGSTYSGNTTLAYWREGSVDPYSINYKLMEKIRFATVRDIDAWSYTQDLTAAWDQADDGWWGDQLSGGFFYDSTVGAEGSLTFVPMWTQPSAKGHNDLYLAYVRMPW
jgi:hypothetical protein